MDLPFGIDSHKSVLIDNTIYTFGGFIVMEN